MFFSSLDELLHSARSSLAEQLLSSTHHSSASSFEARANATLMGVLLEPPLPALLAPLPGLCRLTAALILAPIAVLGMLDFAWYAVFRTLGLTRRRVRVTRTKDRPHHIALPLREAGDVPFPGAGAGTDADEEHSRANASATTSPGQTRAPLLTPGTYDAEALLRHRARSASAASADAEAEWVRTGGSFARVSSVRAAAAAVAAQDAASSVAAKRERLSGSSGSSTPSLDASAASPPLSPSYVRSYLAGRAKGVGVEGALGYFDTDAEESGTEAGTPAGSGRSSPVNTFGRSSSSATAVKIRRAGSGFGGGALGFTPVSPAWKNDRPLASSDGVNADALRAAAEAEAAIAAAADLDLASPTPAAAPR